MGKKTAEQSTKTVEESKPFDKKIHDLIGPIFHEMGITDAIVIAKLPGSEEVAVYYRGHFYDVAALVAEIHRKFKNKIIEEIA